MVPLAPNAESESDRFYVMGGQQRSLRSITAGNGNWEGYHKGLVVEIDRVAGAQTVRLEYVSPPAVCAPDKPEIMFQSGTVWGDRLYTCTGTEVITYSLPGFQQLGYISLPWFNDVHHVRPMADGSLLVANAGLEMVLRLEPQGALLGLWNVLGEEPWARFSPHIDYRRLGSTKPHRAHPNFIFCIGDEIWATRFQQGDAVCLTEQKRFQVSSERIHDGVVHGDHIYFTSVNGTVVIVGTASLRVEEVIQLRAMHPDDTLLGWCRGIMLDGDRMWVGYSRIRPTKARENVAWLMRGFKQALGTRVACYDLRAHVCLYDIDLEPAGLNAVFSIFRWPPAS